MNHETNRVTNQQFIELMNSIADSVKIDDTAGQSHPELVEILQTILYTPCDINIDYADLLRFAQNCEIVSYCITAHKGPKAPIFAAGSALEGLLKKDEKPNAMLTHVILPENYTLDELRDMFDLIECKAQDEAELGFEVKVSSILKPDEIKLYMLCGYIK